jgi:hypothetical protein
MTPTSADAELTASSPAKRFERSAPCRRGADPQDLTGRLRPPSPLPWGRLERDVEQDRREERIGDHLIGVGPWRQRRVPDLEPDQDHSRAGPELPGDPDARSW